MGVAAAPADQLLPRLYELARRAGMPFWSYFLVGNDEVAVNTPEWLVPGTEFYAPESGWTDLLCRRVEEFLKDYKPEWLLFDWFVYGTLKPDFKVKD